MYEKVYGLSLGGGVDLRGLGWTGRIEELGMGLYNITHHHSIKLNLIHVALGDHSIVSNIKCSNNTFN